MAPRIFQNAKPAVAAPSSPAPSTPVAKASRSPLDSGGVVTSGGRDSGGRDSGVVQAFSNSSNESSPAPSPQQLGQFKPSTAAAASESRNPPTESRFRRPMVAALPRASPPRGSSPRSSPRASEVDDEVLDFEELPE